MTAPTFEWDQAKNLANREKHGVASRSPNWPFSMTPRDGVMTVRFTWRDNRIRIFGAGYWRKGKTVYERANKKL
jgi:uncharacterized DUF497 family protein